jgi:cell wall integrity and stress response component
MVGSMLVHGIVSHERDRPPLLHRQPVLLLPAHLKLYLSDPLEAGAFIANSRFQTSSTDTTTTGSVVKETTAAGGEVKTITVSAPGATSGLDTSAANTATASSKLSGGSIAGIVIGVIGGLALLGALIFLVFFYRKRARAASPIPSQDMTDRTSQGSSFVRGVFPQGHSHDLSGSSTLGRKQTFTDNRLKTDIYPNGRRDSSVSLQDNEDYSRPVLRVSIGSLLAQVFVTNILAAHQPRLIQH